MGTAEVSTAKLAVFCIAIAIGFFFIGAFFGSSPYSRGHALQPASPLAPLPPIGGHSDAVQQLIGEETALGSAPDTSISVLVSRGYQGVVASKNQTSMTVNATSSAMIEELPASLTSYFVSISGSRVAASAQVLHVGDVVHVSRISDAKTHATRAIIVDFLRPYFIKS